MWDLRESVADTEDGWKESVSEMSRVISAIEDLPVRRRPGMISLRMLLEPMSLVAVRAPSSQPTPPTILVPTTPATVTAILVEATFSCRSQMLVKSKKSKISASKSTCLTRASRLLLNIFSDLKVKSVYESPR